MTTLQAETATHTPEAVDAQTLETAGFAATPAPPVTLAAVAPSAASAVIMPRAVPAAPDMSGHGQEHSLEKLLTHIESLKKSNHEMNSALTAIIDGNKDKLRSTLSTKIEPWIKSLQIPEEHQKAFLSGIESACQQGQYKGMLDFEKNPAFTVACAAAAAHGKATEEAEEGRKKLQTFMVDNDANNSRQIQLVKDRHNNEQRMLFNAADTGSSALGKRDAPEFSTHDSDMENSKCWETVFNTIQS